MKIPKLFALRLFVLIAAIATGAGVAAEVAQVRIAKQYGISYMPLMIMQAERLLEKRARAAGLGEVTVDWITFAGPAAMNDGLISGSVDFASAGVGPLVTLWAKTKGTPNEVRAVAAMSSYPLFLLTRNPRVRSIGDLTDEDRIAVPAVKISLQAVVLQMAAVRLYGDKNFAKLDHLTVTMSHADASISMLAGKGPINGHFTSPPYQDRQLKDAAIHKLLSTEDVLGVGTTVGMMNATSRFRLENPRTYAAFMAAYQEAIDILNRDKKAAAEVYIRLTNEKSSSVSEITEMLNAAEFSVTPRNTMKLVKFMIEVGVIKANPGSWKDYFFPEAHAFAGS